MQGSTLYISVYSGRRRYAVFAIGLGGSAAHPVRATYSGEAAGDGFGSTLAMLGDVNIAEPNALIGFAGPRVIEQTVRERLPEGFQRSEFLLDHGAIDMIVDRRAMRDEIANLLAKFENRSSPANAAK